MQIDYLRDKILERCKQTLDRACLVGISGIDASGKGYVSSRLVPQLEAGGCRVALINVDGWLNLPYVRFSGSNPGEHFYHHALRLEEMFEGLVLPLEQNRNVDVTIDFEEETATNFRPHTYAFERIDIILLEGIFIFKRKFVQHFDLRIWIECSFQTALQRAIARGQEDLTPAATIAAYQSIYFPAQLLHFEMDEPRQTADLLFRNEQF